MDNPTYESKIDLDMKSVKSYSLSTAGPPTQQAPLSHNGHTQETRPTQRPRHHVYETVNCDEDGSSVGVTHQTISSPTSSCSTDMPTSEQRLLRHDYETVPGFKGAAKPRVDNYDHLTIEVEEPSTTSHLSPARNSQHPSFKILKPQTANYDSLEQRESLYSLSTSPGKSSIYSCLDDMVHGYAVLQLHTTNTGNTDTERVGGGTPDGEYSHLIHHCPRQ